MADTLNDRFIKACKNQNKIMKQEIKEGKKWAYTNKKHRESTFEAARKKNNRLTNCVDGCHWAAKAAGCPANALSWYGGMGGPVWCNPNAEKNAKKVFDLIPIGKSVNTALKKHLLCEGDMLVYTTITHTNTYLGKKKSFDSGHAYCKSGGELAEFTKWIGNTPYGDQKISYVFRFKDRTHYRVICGVYKIRENAIEKADRVNSMKLGFKVTINELDGLYKVQAGYFDGKENAEWRRDTLKEAGIDAFISEV